MKQRFCVVGAGIVGLATARALAQTFPDSRITVIEKEAAVAQHQSGHNSGVLHSGVYYPPNSLKAQLTRRGYRLLLEFCDQQQIPYRLSGKLIVAQDASELPQLEKLYAQGKQNGLQCELWEPDQFHEQEPYCRGIRALWVPEAGVVDFRRVARALQQWLLDRGHQILTNTTFLRAKEYPDAVEIATSQGEMVVDGFIACAGLYADVVAQRSGIAVPARIVPFRGEYYTLVPDKQYLCRGLIYPVPDPRFPFLGVHITRGIDGEVHCGPNAVLAFAREGYRWSVVRPSELWQTLRYSGTMHLIRRYWRTGVAEVVRSLSKRWFYRSVARLLREVAPEDLQRNGSGVRAQLLLPNGQLYNDFFFKHRRRMLHVLNAPSPAATASLAIGEHIVQFFQEVLAG